MGGKNWPVGLMVKRSRERGLSLLELVIAVLVLSIGTLAVFRVFDITGRQVGDTSQRFLAQTVAINRAEEIRVMGWALGRGLPQRVSQGPQVWTVTTSAAQTAGGLYQITIQVRSAEGPGAVLTSFADWVPKP